MSSNSKAKLLPLNEQSYITLKPIYTCQIKNMFHFVLSLKVIKIFLQKCSSKKA